MYSDKSELIAARANDTEHHWWDVPPSKLAVMGSALSFFDPVSWRFYIPAFMTWNIDEWIREGTSCYDDVIGRMVPLYGSDAEADRRIKALDRAQGLAVLSYLAYFREYSGDADDRARADRVIKYWEQRVGEV